MQIEECKSIQDFSPAERKSRAKVQEEVNSSLEHCSFQMKAVKGRTD